MPWRRMRRSEKRGRQGKLLTAPCSPFRPAPGERPQRDIPRNKKGSSTLLSQWHDSFFWDENRMCPLLKLDVKTTEDLSDHVFRSIGEVSLAESLWQFLWRIWFPLLTHKNRQNQGQWNKSVTWFWETWTPHSWAFRTREAYIKARSLKYWEVKRRSILLSIAGSFKASWGTKDLFARMPGRNLITQRAAWRWYLSHVI